MQFLDASGKPLLPGGISAANWITINSPSHQQSANDPCLPI
jgi:hypothetical protein